MSHGIVVIGSGFAARQLIKNLRKQDGDIPIRLIAADSGDEYNKPDLSHVISRGQQADEMTRQTAGAFAEQYRVTVHTHCEVTEIDTVAKQVCAGEQRWNFDKLVLATGAAAIRPPIEGGELMVTLNSQQEYRDAGQQLNQAQRVLILGAGLIGCELAMDFTLAGKQCLLVDQAPALLAALMPPEVSSRLQHHLYEMGVELALRQSLRSLTTVASGIRATLSNGRSLEVDAVVACVGLRPHVALAQRAGLTVNKGIVVNGELRTSHSDIYALGDCAEINGQLMPFLQAIQFSAMTLAKNLLGGQAQLALPPMLIKVKTPQMPLHLAGETRRADLTWHITTDQQGLVARGVDASEQLRAFIVSEDHMPQAFKLLAALSR